MPIYYTVLSGDQSWLAGTQKRYLTCWAVLCFLVQSWDPMRSTNDFGPTWKGKRKKTSFMPQKDVSSKVFPRCWFHDVHDGFFSGFLTLQSFLLVAIHSGELT